MDKDIFKGLKISFGFILGLSILFGLAYAVGFHTADEIISGTFLGNYIFTNNVTFNGVSDFTNSTISGISGGTTTNDIINMFTTLDVGNLPYRKIENGFVDAFNDESGVDNSSSINVSYDGTNNYYWTYSGYILGSNQFSVHSGSTASSGVAYADSIWGVGYEAWKAVDSNGIESIWESSSGAPLPEVWGYNFSNSKIIYGYSIQVDGGYTPLTWNLEAFDGSNWIILDNQSFITSTDIASPSLAWSNIFNLSIIHSYDKYRMYITNIGGNGDASLAGIKFYNGSRLLNNITLISNNFTAQSSPTTAEITILEEDVDTTILNTDIIAEVSNDGGTNWDNVTLSYKGNYSSTIRILSGSASSLTGTGTDIKYNITTYNSKQLKIHGVGMTWS